MLLTFGNRKQNLIYTLSLDVNFAELIATDAQWQKKTAATPDRGLSGNNGATTQQRVGPFSQKGTNNGKDILKI